MIFLKNKCGDYWEVEYDEDDYYYGDGREAFIIGLPDEKAKEIAEEILEKINKK